METFSKTSTDLYFISGGGEMGKLIRSTDWSKTSLGAPELWPQSLRTAVAIMLDNPFGMYIAWGHDFIQLYNDGYRPILGSNKHPQALGISTRETFAEVWDIVGPMFEDVMKGKAVGFPDFMLPLNRDGVVEECYFDFSYSPIRKENGETGGVLVTVIETTEKKKTALAFKESESHIRSIISSLPLVVWMAAKDGSITYISSQWETSYGNSVSKSLGNGWANYVHPDDIEGASAFWAASIKNGTDYETEFRVQHKDGGYRWILVRAIPNHNASGEIISWTGSNTDIQDKKLTEAAALESEERFRTMADNIPNLAWMANADGWIYWYNKKWYDYTGTKPEQMEGWGWQSVHDPEELPRVVEKWQGSISSGEPFEMVFPLKGADEKFRPFLTRVLPVRDSEGKIRQWFGSNTDISHQIKSEQAVKESENRLVKLTDSVPAIIWITQPDGYCTYLNKQWFEFTGQDEEEAKGFGWLAATHPDDKAKAGEVFIDANEKQVAFSVLYRLRSKNGTYRWAMDKGSPMFDLNGNYAGMVGTVIDMHDVKLAEEEKLKVLKALQESETKLRSVIAAAPAAIALFVGRDLIVEMPNKTFIDIVGKGPEISGKPLREIMPELITEGQPFLHILDDVYTKGEMYQTFDTMVKIAKDGTLRENYYNFTYTPIFDTDGKVYAILDIAVDVTQQVKTRQIIEESERNLRNTILQAPVAMCILKGPLHTITLANERMFELWGKSGDAVLNKPLLEALPEMEGQGFDVLLDGVYSTGKSYSAQGVPATLLRDQKIETVYVNFVYAPYLEIDGSVSGILAVAIDVTAQVIARQKIEEVVADRTKELAEANNNLQKSNAELAQFAYIASHDLQEPLRKITTFSQMLENRIGNKLDEQSKNYLEKINNSSTRMTRLIRDVLTYSELVKENEVYAFVNLNEIIASIETDYELLIEQKGADIIAGDLPIIQAIPLQMSQLFGNLIGNALKFARKDAKPVITINATTLSRDEAKTLLLDADVDYYKIQVSDNGIGFKKEYAEQIFNIFQRLHRRSEFEGTGIGLAMCKKIVLNHHGELNAKGSSEAGAIFNVILPIKQLRIK